MLIDDYMPSWDWDERHSTRVAAPPERIDAAARAMRVGDLPVTRLLMAIRTLRLRGGGPPLLEVSCRPGPGCRRPTTPRGAASGSTGGS